jgi:hypothetical protein
VGDDPVYGAFAHQGEGGGGKRVGIDVPGLDADANYPRDNKEDWHAPASSEGAGGGSRNEGRGAFDLLIRRQHDFDDAGVEHADTDRVSRAAFGYGHSSGLVGRSFTGPDQGLNGQRIAIRRRCCPATKGPVMAWHASGREKTG